MCVHVCRSLLGSHVMVILSVLACIQGFAGQSCDGHSQCAGVLLGSHVMVIHSVFAGACWVVLWWSFTMCLYAYQVIHNVFLVTHNVRVRTQGFAGWSHDGHSQCVCVYAGACWAVMWWSFTMCLHVYRGHSQCVCGHSQCVCGHSQGVCICRGLLGGHVMASYFKRRGLGLSWYNDELLSRAKEVGDRLLPAFNTSTGIPYPRVSVGLICKPNPVPYWMYLRGSLCTLYLLACQVKVTSSSQVFDVAFVWLLSSSDKLNGLLIQTQRCCCQVGSPVFWSVCFILKMVAVHWDR